MPLSTYTICLYGYTQSVHCSLCFSFIVSALIKTVIEYINGSFEVMVCALWCHIKEPDKTAVSLEETGCDHTVKLLFHWQGKHSQDTLYSYHLCFHSLFRSCPSINYFQATGTRMSKNIFWRKLSGNNFSLASEALLHSLPLVTS